MDEGWLVSEVAARFQVSWPTVKRWADRDRAAGPQFSPAPLAEQDQPGDEEALYTAPAPPAKDPCSSHVDRATGELVRCYEHDCPGVMLHGDVEKLGSISEGGGWRYVGGRQGEKNRVAALGKPRNKYRDPLMGRAFVHSVIGGHSRVGRRPMERWGPFTALWLTAGPPPAAIPPRPNVGASWTGGFITTTIIGPTQLAGTSLPSHD
ncbi:hypothetical protein HMPREF3223_00356 [Cutibacterium avidum]|nr:hypothetical protein HMPREF3223_00356 [Cutibacterium avidum]